ncbi:hypothetical protein GpartN1_g5630.t1 [Galdieria partita]|uniref:Membrane protein insertion efficiency factor n=1 Tax=Galdieria partita TaxID=83374 RepID=A0A9C7US82_9RHOD|nr:hypothetical protein GpartN1_g5630.t1 [Galdieria partita]
MKVLAKDPVYHPIHLWNVLHTCERFTLTCLFLYKRHISPLLPRACRFIPNCSEYSIQSIQQFGLERGLILTVWRLLRCQPFGGYGYDPPQWPPPSWFRRGYER